MNIDNFNSKIEDIIRLFEYDGYVVHPDTKINCICQDRTTHQGDPKCPNCLGFGKKIYITKIKAARQPYVLTDLRYETRAGSDAFIYYTRSQYPLYKGDIIISGDAIDVVQYAEKYQSNSASPIYYQAYMASKKFNREVFLRNFYQIIKR